MAVWGCRAEKPRATQPKKMAASKHQEAMTKTQMSREPRSFIQSRWYKLTSKANECGVGWVPQELAASEDTPSFGEFPFPPLLFSLSDQAFSTQSCELNVSSPRTHLEVRCARSFCRRLSIQSRGINRQTQGEPCQTSNLYNYQIRTVCCFKSFERWGNLTHQ